MNDDMIARWNQAVGPTDTVYHLGDFGFKHRSGGRPLADIFSALRGRKHLIIGNHDEENKDVLKLPWESMSKLITLKDNGVRAELCHYPIESWKKAHKDALMLHGHCHGELKRLTAHRFDVGVDVWRRPMMLEEFAGIASKQTFEPSDHHGDL